MECVFEAGQILFCLNLNLLPLNTPNQMFDLLTIVCHCLGHGGLFFTSTAVRKFTLEFIDFSLLFHGPENNHTEMDLNEQHEMPSVTVGPSFPVSL